MKTTSLCCVLSTILLTTGMNGQTNSPIVTTTPNPITTLMQKAVAHAAAHHTKYVPVLSPVYQTVLDGSVDVAAMHAMGVDVIPWTVNDGAAMKALLARHVDGIISDDPVLLMQVVREAQAAAVASGNATEVAYFAKFDPQAHRGGRALRPENTLPSFENGMDQGVHTLETDTGVTTDGQSMIWHDQFLNPQSCRRADGAAYTLENKVYTRDISMAEARATFVCDKLHFGAQQKNDLALSPVAVAFARKEGMPSPYAPTNAAQLMRFAAFYATYYRTGAGKGTPHAAERVRTGETVGFNLETKIQGDDWPGGNHTKPAQAFVDALVGAIKAEHMETRGDVQSFYFGTLLLIQEQHPDIRTVYLTGPVDQLATMVPEELR